MARERAKLMPMSMPIAPATVAEQTTPASRAIALILQAQRDRRKVKQKDIAAAVGAERTIFYCDPALKGVWQAYKQSFRLAPARGYVDSDGNLEAEDGD